MIDLDEETKAWLAIRKEVAKAIDPATAEFDWEYGNVVDPYRIYPRDGSECIGRNHFARAPGSDVWVSFDDLPESVRDELWKRAVAEGHVLQIVVRPDGRPRLRGMLPELAKLFPGLCDDDPHN